jgi:response regulator RpfG family c-di-GMP phosphodiesterase
MDLFNLFCHVGIAINEIEQNDAGNAMEKTMHNIALKSALMLTTRVIQIINPELHLHMQRTALIALELAQASGLSRQQQQTIFCAALHDIGVLGDKRVFLAERHR